MEEAQRALTARQFRRWVAFFDAKPSRDPALVGLAIVGYEVYLTRLQIKALFDDVVLDRKFSDYVMGDVPEVEEEDELEGADTGTILAAKLEMHAQRRAAWLASIGVGPDGKPPIFQQGSANNPKAFEKAMR